MVRGIRASQGQVVASAVPHVAVPPKCLHAQPLPRARHRATDGGIERGRVGAAVVHEPEGHAPERTWRPSPFGGDPERHQGVAELVQVRPIGDDTHREVGHHTPAAVGRGLAPIDHEARTVGGHAQTLQEPPRAECATDRGYVEPANPVGRRRPCLESSQRQWVERRSNHQLADNSCRPVAGPVHRQEIGEAGFLQELRCVLRQIRGCRPWRSPASWPDTSSQRRNPNAALALPARK